MAEDRYPKDLRYTVEHEWVRLDGDRATVGITWFAQDQLGDVVFVELPSVGDRFETDDPFGVVESVKTVSDLYMPLGGEVVEVNDQLEVAPEQVNAEPYGDGWIIVIKADDPSAAEELMTADDYRERLEGDA